MYLNTTTEHPNLVSGSPIPVPAAFTPLLAAPSEVGYHAVYANWTYQFAAIDPPASAHGAKIGSSPAPAQPQLRPRLLASGGRMAVSPPGYGGPPGRAPWGLGGPYPANSG